ncbi:class I SAM-dependent methyltransferase [Ancylomarina euxinus]|uniref:Class I SAM-dependent methyltransferase n=2 Tax=Ancylomarina euxinus TaxID=2283627 RepID=A0A425Y0Z3_9BACT|nr:class I SAM-dependent methyltransferase [Ancylomarina euxinus]
MRKYEHHQNEPEDLVYQEYLKQIMDPVLERISVGAKGLDFGCGPGPALSQMFEIEGCQMDIYDAYFAPNEEVFARSYDFITACEVVEHFHKPRMEFDRLFSMLKPGGVLAIKTQLSPCDGTFPQWFYKRDMTHVCFFFGQKFEVFGCKMWS